MVRYVIVFSLALVAFLTYTFPPLADSKSFAAGLSRSILSALISGCLGCGLAWSLLAVLG